MRAVLTSLFLLAAVPASAATVTVIDVPGALDTMAGAISPSGTVAGSYAPNGQDPCGQQCGFLRTPDGTFQTFSVFDTANAHVTAVLDDGTSVGGYIKGRHTRGFARAPNGTLTDIFPHKSDTVMAGLNTSGTAFGSTSAGIAFLRTPDGKIGDLRIRGCRGGVVFAAGINVAGTVAGSCFHKNKIIGFIRAFDGTVSFITNRHWQFADVFAIDDTGAVAGIYAEQVTGERHAYIRDADGKFTHFDLPSGVAFIVAMAVVGGDRQVVGWLQTGADERLYGFIHHSNGSDEVFDVSGAHGSQSGTIVSGISPAGAIVGHYFDDNLHSHGYIRTP